MTTSFAFEQEDALVTTSRLVGGDITRSLHEVAQQLRVDSVRCSAAASSGHPTSALSAADLMAVLLARYLRYDFRNPDAPGNDHLIFSKGHASALYYAMLRAAGAISEQELLTYRQIRSRLEGHPTPRLPWVDVATGSIGQGLPIGAGMAMAGKRLDKLPYRVWVLCGDGELTEGSIWEAAEQAGASGLDNLSVIVDVNRFGQRGPTRHGWDTSVYAARFRAFGWRTQEIDGHDIGAIDQALAAATAELDGPSVILARTRKGRGVAAVEDREDTHGQPLADPEAAIGELGGLRDLRVRVAPPVTAAALPAQRARAGGQPAGATAADGPRDRRRLRLVHGRRRDPGPALWCPPGYQPGDMVATRTAFGEALAALGEFRPDVVVLDGGVSESTRTALFARAHPDRFFECYTAEQQMLAAAVGMQARGWVPFAATFAAFFSRAHDFIRMAAIGQASIRLVGSHSGVTVGQDGPSQMALEDIAALRAVHGSTVLCPCDANQAAWLTGVLADLPGVSYLRTCQGEARSSTSRMTASRPAAAGCCGHPRTTR